MTAADPQRPLRADAERNRRLILETARRAFAERGLGVRLDEIAAEAGVGTGTVYRHFSKDELVRSLFEEALGAVVTIADRALAEDQDGTGLRRFLEEVLTLMAEDRGLGQLLIGAADRSGGLSARGRTELEPRVAALAAAAQAAGRLRTDLGPEDLPVVQVMLTAMIDATGVVDRELWRRYVPLLLDALAPRPGDVPLPGRPPSGDAVAVILERWRAQPREPGARG